MPVGARDQSNGPQCHQSTVILPRGPLAQSGLDTGPLRLLLPPASPVAFWGLSFLMTLVTQVQGTCSSAQPHVSTASTQGQSSGRKAQFSLFIKPPIHIHASDEVPIPLVQGSRAGHRPGPFPKPTLLKG